MADDDTAMSFVSIVLASGAVAGCASASILQRLSAHRLLACASLLGLLLTRICIATLTASLSSRAEPDSTIEAPVSFIPCIFYICVAPLVAFMLLACNPRTDTSQLLDGSVTYQLSETQQRLVIWATVCALSVSIAWEGPAHRPDLYGHALPCAIVACLLKLWRHPLWLALLGPVVAILAATVLQSAVANIHALLPLPCLSIALDQLLLGLVGTLAYQAYEETKTQSFGLRLYSTGRAADSSVLTRVSGWSMPCQLGLAVGFGVKMAVLEVGLRHATLSSGGWSVEAQALVNSALAGLSTGKRS